MEKVKVRTENKTDPSTGTKYIVNVFRDEDGNETEQIQIPFPKKEEMFYKISIGILIASVVVSQWLGL